MTADLFPAMQPALEVEPSTTSYSLYTDVAWDIEQNKAIFKDGAPVIVEGQEAVLGWVCRALYTVQGRYEAHADDYGCAMQTLVGQGFSAELTTAEAERYIEECLLQNDYITNVSEVETWLEDDVLHASCVVMTVYDAEGVMLSV